MLGRHHKRTVEAVIRDCKALSPSERAQVYATLGIEMNLSPIPRPFMFQTRATLTNRDAREISAQIKDAA